MPDIPVNPDYIRCGFFDAIETSPGEYDRVYSAEDMCMPYYKLVSDGVFATDESSNEPANLKVVAGTGLHVVVQAGTGIFNRKWFELTTNQSITVPENQNEDGYDRIDTVLVRISSVTRDGSILYRPGEPAEEPVPPEITPEGDFYEYRLANILVTNEASEIVNGDISDRRGIDTPFVASLVQTLSTQQLFTQWDDLFNSYFLAKKAEVDEFIRTLTEDLTVMMSLQDTIDTITIDEDTYTISVSNFDDQTDVIFVIVNGFITTDYTVNAASTELTFTNELKAGTKVTTRILKSLKAPPGSALPYAEGSEF